MIVYPVDKELKVEIGDASFYIMPLTAGQKSELLNYTKVDKGEDVPDGMEMVRQALRFALKRVEGVDLPNGSKYKLKFDPDGYCDLYCCDTLLTASASLTLFTARLANGTIDHNVEGVTVCESTAKKKKLRASAK